MSETPEPTTPEQQDVQQPTQDAEPLYGQKDVERALHTSGQRALASSYFTNLGVQGIPEAEANAMIAAIENGQVYDPTAPQVNPLESGAQPEAEQDQTAPPEGEPA
jgi:hypothetical protein